MRVLIKPGRHAQGTGITATITWGNPDFEAAINAMFNVRQDVEKISQVEITDTGITARLEYIPHKVKAGVTT